MKAFLIVVAAAVMTAVTYLILSRKGILSVATPPIPNPPGAPDDRIERIMQAIARAEGFFVEGSVPYRANNPGDLKLGDKGHGLINGITVFDSDEEGWAALRNQVTIIVEGRSPVYNEWARELGKRNSSELTIAEIAQKYTATEQDHWARNVASALGMSVNDPLGGFLA